MWTLSDLLDTYHALLTSLSALTLGEIWRKLYNPPTPLNLSIALVLITLQIPRWTREWKERRISQRVVRFDWPLPEVGFSLGLTALPHVRALRITYMLGCYKDIFDRR